MSADSLVLTGGEEAAMSGWPRRESGAEGSTTSSALARDLPLARSWTSSPRRAVGVTLAAFTVAALLLSLISFVVGVSDTWVFVLLLVGVAVAMAVLGVLTGWRVWTLVWSAPAMVVLFLAGAYLVGVTLPSVGPLLRLREQRVMVLVEQYAAEAGFTALVSPERGLVTDAWPVRRVADPAGFVLSYEGLGSADQGFELAEQAAPRSLSAAELRALVAPGTSVGPGWGGDRAIPADASHHETTVDGHPAVGVTMVWRNENGTAQPGVVLVVDHGGVIVRAWQLGDNDLAYLEANLARLVPLTER